MAARHGPEYAIKYDTAPMRKMPARRSPNASVLRGFGQEYSEHAAYAGETFSGLIGTMFFGAE